MNRCRVKLCLPLVLALLALVPASAVRAQPFGGYLDLVGNETSTPPESLGQGYLEVASTPDLTPTGTAITIELWARLDTPFTGCRSLIGKNYHQTYWIGVCGSTLRSYLKGDGSQKDGGEVPSNVWTHIAVTYDGTTRRHYINGVEVASFPQTGNLASNTSPLRIGSDISWPFSPAGSIDEVRIWSVARTAAQLQSTMHTPLSSPAPGLIAVWSFDNNGNDIVGGHNGTLVGATSFGPPAPPGGPWLSGSALPGYQIKVRLTTGDTTRLGTLVSDCIAQTLCVAGVFPDRPEVLVRVVGPRSNGYLWPIVVRFTNAQVEVWIQQNSTGTIRYYKLPFVGPDSSELNGVNDRFGFLP